MPISNKALQDQAAAADVFRYRPQEKGPARSLDFHRQSNTRADSLVISVVLGRRRRCLILFPMIFCYSTGM